MREVGNGTIGTINIDQIGVNRGVNRGAKRRISVGHPGPFGTGN